MSDWQVKRRGWLALNAAALQLTLGMAGGAWAQHIHPATPCPCCADGMCYPKRDTWGNYTTNWRPWPGQTTGVIQTPEDERLESVRERLPPSILPRPDQEDQRGPARPPRSAAPGVRTEVNELPAAEGQPAPDGGQPPAGQQQQAPALDDIPAPEGNIQLPGFDPQGALQPLPRTEDGPPELPRSLSQALLSHYDMQPNGWPNANVTTISAAANHSMVPPITQGMSASGSRYVTPAAGTANIELTNPAAQNVQKTMDQDLRHAIYLEDQLDGMK